MKLETWDVSCSVLPSLSKIEKKYKRCAKLLKSSPRIGANDLSPRKAQKKVNPL